MKRILFLSICSIFILVSCISSSESGSETGKSVDDDGEILESPYPGPTEIYDLLLKWEQVLRNRDMELLKEIMPKPWVRYTPSSGEEVAFCNYRSIETFLFEYFDLWGPLDEYSISGLSEYYVIHDNIQVYHFNRELDDRGTVLLELMGFNNFEGSWVFDGISLNLFKDQTFVTNHLSAMADTDNDGFLTDRDEINYDLVLRSFFEGPHETEGFFDEFFDNDRDGMISAGEIALAAELMVGRGFRFCREAFGIFVLEFDRNGNEFMEDTEIDEMTALLSNIEGERDKRDILLNTINWFPVPDYVFQAVPREVSTYIDQLADGNDDGWIDEIEQRIIDTGFTEGHHVAHYFDSALDRNKDGDVNWNELYIALQASAKEWGEIVLAPPPYPAHTPTDRLLDTNSDGLIDEEEIKTHVILFSGQPAAASFLSGELVELLDIDDDGSVDAQEIQKVKAGVFYPRAVNPDWSLDTESDFDENGFLDVLEIGIIAGEAAGTPITSFDNRIDLYRRREDFIQADSIFNKTFLENKDKMKNRHLAVLDIELGLSSLDPETADIITVFVENAFVNLGSVSLVDRRNIDKLYNEINFQLSGMVDEDTAVEIGEMTGADVIAVGEINELEGRYFLNVKVIGVETSEILGSSISQTDDPEKFLDLANHVVNKLF